MAITYHRWNDDTEPGELLIADASGPVLAPRLLAESGYAGPGDLPHVPALQCAEDNWDWALWAETTATPLDSIRIAHVFDTDDAALFAVAGLGMVLAPTLITTSELRMGPLVELPGSQPIAMGSYRMMGQPDRHKLVRDFCKWLRYEARRGTAEY